MVNGAVHTDRNVVERRGDVGDDPEDKPEAGPGTIVSIFARSLPNSVVLTKAVQPA